MGNLLPSTTSVFVSLEKGVAGLISVRTMCHLLCQRGQQAEDLSLRPSSGFNCGVGILEVNLSIS